MLTMYFLLPNSGGRIMHDGVVKFYSILIETTLTSRQNANTCRRDVYRARKTRHVVRCPGLTAISRVDN